MYKHLLQIFEQSNLKIKSHHHLKLYIKFCLNNNTQKRITFKSSHHHILPKAKDCFSEYKDLKINDWNGVHLLHKDHYYAHWLFTEAIHIKSQLYAFIAMHNKDFKSGKLTKKDLVDNKMFQLKMEEKNKNHSIYQQTVTESGLTNAQINVRKGVEIRHNKIDPSTGLTSYQESGKKVSLHRSKVNPETGITYGKEASVKAALTMSKIDPETGLTIREMADIKRLATRKRNEELKNLS